MPYENWTSKVEVLSYGPWVTAKSLKRTLGALQGTNFSIQEQRNQAMARIADLGGEAPFGAEDRFPDVGLYVCLDYLDWGSKMRQLRSSLLVKDYAKDDKHKGSTTVDISDNIVSFHHSISSMLDELNRLDGVFNRESFEDTFCLEWAE